MATHRVISPEASPDPGEESSNFALRPESIDEYVGQAEVVERIRIAVDAARGRGEALEHLLLHGPPGLGKTTLAHVVAREMGTTLHTTSGPVLARPTDLVATLTRLGAGDVLFIDEIHRLPVAIEEFIYPAMEDFKIDVTIDSGMHARSVELRCKPFTLIGATTRAGLLSAPLRSRFGLNHHLRYYTEGELTSILTRSSSLLGIESPRPDALGSIATRSRGTPRVANRLLRRVRDYAAVRLGGAVDRVAVDKALELEGVDALGLDELDRAYLLTLARTFEGGPAGLEAIAATMNQDASTLEDVVEPFLLQVGFVARTRRGRSLTAAGAGHVGVSLPADERGD